MNIYTLPEIQALHAELHAATQDARALTKGLSAEFGELRVTPGSWSIAECLDHLATANRVYLRPMEEAAQRAQAHGSRRSGGARPGIIGRMFVWTLEPPPKKWIWMPAPRSIKPRVRPSLADAFESFIASQADVHAFLNRYGSIDLASVRFKNPFIPGVRFSLATGLHVITAHERRHLLQAWKVRRALEDGPHSKSVTA